MSGKPWYNNGQNEVVPEGFVRGRLPLSDITKQKLSLSNKNKSQEEKIEINKKRSVSLKKSYANKSQEERDNIVQKRTTTMNNKSIEEKLEYRKNLSQSLRGKNKGKIPWNKGLNKEIDERVLANSIHTSETNLKNATIIKLNDPEYFNRWRSSINDVMRKNNSFNRSLVEDDYYKDLISLYGESDVIRWYSDDRYPFACDFYIPSKDLFIELNKHWTHGGHLFDNSNPDDILLLQNWQLKAETSKYYKNAIYMDNTRC